MKKIAYQWTVYASWLRPHRSVHSLTIWLWEIATGKQQDFEGHLESILAVAISHDGRLLASADGRLLTSDFWDNTVRLWDIATGTLQYNLMVKGLIISLEFSMDDSHLITNLGSCNIQFGCRSDASDAKPLYTGISILDGRWIARHGDKILRLPSEYLTRCLATMDGTLVLGHPSGQILFIDFDENLT